MGILRLVLETQERTAWEAASVMGPEPPSRRSPSWDEGCAEKAEILVHSPFQFPFSKHDCLGILCPCPRGEPEGKQRVPELLSPPRGRNPGCPHVFPRVVRTSVLFQQEGVSPLRRDCSLDLLFALETRNWVHSKLKAVFSPRGRPGGNKTVLNTMFVYFTSGGCHYWRKEKKKTTPCIKFQ